MYIAQDPTTALRMAELHQADVRAAFTTGRPVRRWWRRSVEQTSRPTATPRATEVRVPSPRQPERQSISA